MCVQQRVCTHVVASSGKRVQLELGVQWARVLLTATTCARLAATDTTASQQYEFLVSLQQNDVAFCAGNLVTHEWVLHRGGHRLPSTECYQHVRRPRPSHTYNTPSPIPDPPTPLPHRTSARRRAQHRLRRPCAV